MAVERFDVEHVERLISLQRVLRTQPKRKPGNKRPSPRQKSVKDEIPRVDVKLGPTKLERVKWVTATCPVSFAVPGTREP